MHLVSPPIGSLELQLLGSNSSKKIRLVSLQCDGQEVRPITFQLSFLMGLKRFLWALDQMEVRGIQRIWIFPSGVSHSVNPDLTGSTSNMH